MDFPVFEHARLLADAWARGPPRHDLGGSAFTPDEPLQGLPTQIVESDVAGLDLHAAAGFREAVAARLGVGAEEVLPTAGTTAANLAVLAAFVRPGTRVVCERPYYAPLPHTAAGFGARVHFVDRAGDGHLDPAAVADAIDDRTSLVLLSSPHNPTGRASSRSSLLHIAEAAHGHGAHVLVDQVFRELTGHALATGHPALVSTGGLNKCWGAPGLRVGWLAADAPVVERLEEVHRLLLLAPSAPGTRIATHLLGLAHERRTAFETRTSANRSAFRAWCDQHGLPPVHGELVASVPAPARDTTTLASRLLDHGILTVPGEAFGREGHLRIGLGGPTRALEAGLAALARAWV